MFRLEHQLPPWPPGFTGYLCAQLLDGLSTGYLPWYAVQPLPPLYEAGIVYRPDPAHGSGREIIANPWEVYERGWTDCDGATLWRLVELKFRGERVGAGPRTRYDWIGPDIHVQVRRANGRLEDPSLVLLGQQGYDP